MSDDFETRQAIMHTTYRDMLTPGRQTAAQELLRDYAPHENYLHSLSGRVIDIGGGAGIAARFLSADVGHVVVEPSEIWRSSEWAELAREFRAGGPEPRFVTAFGEDLPFTDGEFDAALAFWSLNHVRDPARCVAEMIRVLKPGGSARLVIDDMEPAWSDLMADGWPRIRARLGRSSYAANIAMPLRTALVAKLSGRWPLQEDHVRIREQDLYGWIGDRMSLTGRTWLAGSLTIDFVRR